MRVTIYGDQGATLLASDQAGNASQDIMVRFQAVEAGAYFIKIEPLVPNLMGTDAVYSIRVAAAQDIFMPLTIR